MVQIRATINQIGSTSVRFGSLRWWRGTCLGTVIEYHWISCMPPRQSSLPLAPSPTSLAKALAVHKSRIPSPGEHALLGRARGVSSPQRLRRQALLEFGGNPNLKDRWGSTPMQDALKSRSMGAAKILQKHQGVLELSDPAGGRAHMCWAKGRRGPMARRPFGVGRRGRRWHPKGRRWQTKGRRAMADEGPARAGKGPGGLAWPARGRRRVVEGRRRAGEG